MLVDVMHYHHLQNNHYSNSLHTCIQKEKLATKMEQQHWGIISDIFNPQFFAVTGM